MRRYVCFAAVALTLACDRGSTTACTMIGCANDLTVEIQNAPPGPITVQATPVGTPVGVHTAACPGETGCTNTVYFRDFAPVHVHLTVTTTAGNATVGREAELPDVAAERARVWRHLPIRDRPSLVGVARTHPDHAP